MLAGKDGPVLTWRLIPAGKILMGCPATEPGHEGDERLHAGTVAESFHMKETHEGNAVDGEPLARDHAGRTIGEWTEESPESVAANSLSERRKQNSSYAGQASASRGSTVRKRLFRDAATDEIKL